VSGLLCFFISAYVLGKSGGQFISWDIFGYYLYLPATFIYHDPGLHDLSPVHHVLEVYQSTPTLYQVAEVESGNHIIMYSMGMAMVYLPFFLFGHLTAFIGGYPPDGFSAPYEFWMMAGDIFYLFAGVLLFRKWCRLFFSEQITTWLILALVAGTNFLFLQVGMIGMPHIYLFAWFTLALILMHQWYLRPTKKTAFFLGITLGVLTLCRPTELLILPLMIAWKIKSFAEFKSRLNWLFSDMKIHLLVLFLGALLIGFPQLFYWKWYTGKWLFMSYTNPGEGFDFLHPHIWNFLFSFRKGWLIYTPLMILSFWGMMELYKKQRAYFFPVLFFILLNIWVLSSWSNWWYASSFGQRPVIDSYAVMMLPLGYLLMKDGTWKKIIDGFLFCFIFLNLFQTWQMENRILDTYRLTADYYFKTFLRTEIPPGAKNDLLVDREKAFREKCLSDSSMYRHKLEFIQDYEFPENRGGGFFTSDTSYSGKLSYCLAEKDAQAPFLKVAYHEITQLDHFWTKIEAEVMPLSPIDSIRPVFFATMLNFRNEGYAWEGHDHSEFPELKQGQWNKVSFWYLSPEIRSEKDIFCVSLWMTGSGRILIDKLTIRTYSRD